MFEPAKGIFLCNIKPLTTFAAPVSSRHIGLCSCFIKKNQIPNLYLFLPIKPIFSLFSNILPVLFFCMKRFFYR